MLFVIIIIIIVMLFLFFKVVKPYKLEHDTLISFTGTNGSGKTFFGVKYSISLYYKQCKKVRIHNLVNKYFKHSNDIWAKPLLYSNIPLRINKKLWATPLTAKHLLLQERLELRSVVFIDEVGIFASQWDFKNPNVVSKAPFEEFIRFCRHYLKGCYIIVTEQCSSNIVLNIRRRLSSVYSLSGFHKILFVCWTSVRHIQVTEDTLNVNTSQVEDTSQRLFSLLPLLFKHYDTYCYSERYNSVPKGSKGSFTQYKSNTPLEMPSETYRSKTLKR